MSAFRQWSVPLWSKVSAAAVAATVVVFLGCATEPGDRTSNPPPSQHALTVRGAGAGDGSVSSAPSGITCTITGGTASGTCAPDFEAGTSVRLTASPSGGSTFTGWSGGGCSGTAPCVVMMNQARTVTAAFEPTMQTTVVIRGVGVGSGNVSTVRNSLMNCDIVAGIAGGPICSQSYWEGTYTITFAATADPGSVFVSWGGNCVVNALGECDVSPTGPQTVVATFQ